jgi:hypothetical protein
MAPAMTQLPELFTARLLSHNAKKGFYILSDGKRRFFAGGRHFPNGLNTDALVTFTIQAVKRENCLKSEK